MEYHYCARVVVKLCIDISVLWFCLDILTRGNDNLNLYVTGYVKLINCHLHPGNFDIAVQH